MPAPTPLAPHCQEREARFDQEAFARLFPTMEEFTSLTRAVRGTVFRMLRNDTDTDDVMGEAMLDIVRKGGTYAGDSSVRSWMTSVALNRARRFLEVRSTRERRVAHYAEPPESLTMNEDLLMEKEESETRERLLRAVYSAAEAGQYDDYLVPYLMGVQTSADIALARGMNQETVKTRLRRQRVRLQEALGVQKSGDSFRFNAHSPRSAPRRGDPPRAAPHALPTPQAFAPAPYPVHPCT